MQALFRHLAPDQISGRKIRFRTRAVGDSEVLKEWSGIPSSFATDFLVSTDGDVQLAPLSSLPDQESQAAGDPPDMSGGSHLNASSPSSPYVAGPEADSPPLTLAPANKKSKAERKADQAAKERIEGEAFIEEGVSVLLGRTGRDRDPTAGPGRSNSLKFYGKNQRKAMIAEHSGMDITQPDQLRAWQELMLTRHGDPILRKPVESVDPTVMALGAGAGEVGL